ncbi:Protein saal1 [Porites harrisoni]
MDDRNPSPPRLSAEEIELIQCDNIGDTVFSKKWVLATLMKLIQSVQTNAEGSQDDFANDEQQREQQQSAREVEDFHSHDLDDDFERELCELWDMSMNADVATFLEEMETTEVLLDAVLRSQSARVTEICVGILANMACSHEVCTKMMRNKELVNLVAALLDEPDAPVLVEVTRLIHVCLSNNEVLLKWMDVLETETVFKNLMYILENSLNVDLLTNCSQVVDKVLDSSDEMLRTWADLPLVTAVCEAMKQMHMRSEQLHIVETLLHILQMISTVEQGVQGLVSCVSVVPLLCHFVAECGHDEGGIIVGREVSLMESFSVLNVILVADPISVLKAMEKEPRIMKVLLGLLGYSCKIHRKRSKSSLNRFSFSENEEKRLERSLSHEEKPVRDQKTDSETNTAGDQPSGNSSGIKRENNTNEGNDVHVSSSDHIKNAKEEQADEAEGSRRESIEVAACSSRDELFNMETATDHEEGHEGDIPDVHHQYFTVGTGFLKDVISESAKAPKCVSSMIAPHETLLQKIVHYASRIKVYNTLVSDLVESTLSISELSSLHKKLSERLYTHKVH